MNIQALSEYSNHYEENNIEIWYGYFNNYIDHIQYLNSLLSEQEMSRLQKFVFEKEKLMYTVSHGILRIILGNKINIAPEQINYHFNQNEKPFVDIPDCYFNLSHTNNFFTIGFSNKHTVGVDTETHNRKMDWEHVAKLFFSESEVQSIYAALPHEQLKTFIAYWTRKEAILKAIGCGMVNNLKEIDSVDDVFNTDNLFITENNLTEQFIRYYLQTFSLNEMIISISHPVSFGISANEFNLNL